MWIASQGICKPPAYYTSCRMWVSGKEDEIGLSGEGPEGIEPKK